jgi:hypothetical protein
VIVDSGASAVVMDEALLATLGDPARPVLEGAAFGTIGGTVSGFHSRVWRLRAGAVSLDDVPVIVARNFPIFESVSRETGKPVRALIGGSFLRHFLATLDYQGQALRLARYDDPTHVAADEWVQIGVTFERDGDDWIASDVYTNRDAYQKGLRRGDVVEELAGVPLRGQPGETVDGILDGFTLGEEVELKYRRGGSLSTVRVLVEDLLPHYLPPA